MTVSKQSRRQFLTLTAAASLSHLVNAQGESSATLSITGTELHTIPPGFIGLSYESAQLANPAFFSADNKALIALFRELSPSGVLRIGGGSSEFTTYSASAPTTPPPFETFGPDTSRTAKSGTITTAFALQNLRAFLDATGWRCLYGLNLGQGTKENAVAEAEATHRILGPHLLALQIGNEPDSFRNRYRPATYGPDDFLREWISFHDAILTRVPAAKFAGPDISNKLAYLTAFAAIAPQHPDIILLTSHYYAMGPAGNPAATLDNLLDPEPKLTTLKNRDLHIIQEAREAAHLPYRMSEGNSCWNGGQTGVSDVFAAALWAADYSLECAARGWAGVNFHGGGNGIYSPIVGTPATGFTRKPLFFGISFMWRFLGARILESQLQNAPPRISAYVLEKNSQRELVLINKTSVPFTCTLPLDKPRVSLCATPILELTAPAIDARESVRLVPVKGTLENRAQVPPYSARIFQLFPVPFKGGGKITTR